MVCEYSLPFHVDYAFAGHNITWQLSTQSHLTSKNRLITFNFSPIYLQQTSGTEVIKTIPLSH